MSTTDLLPHIIGGSPKKEHRNGVSIMSQNLYYDCRFKASRSNMALRNRARAAELLGISESSLSNYETGKTKCVPAEMVDKMATLYNAPELRNIYCVQCPIGCRMHLAVSVSPIEKIAIHLFNSTIPLTDTLGKFLRIAAKGRVDESEKKMLEEIAGNFDNLTYATSEFFIFAERQGVSWN